MSKKKSCTLCRQTPIISNGKYNLFDSMTIISNGDWVTMYIGADENGKIMMKAYAENETDAYYPKFCPECGRRLQEANNENLQC